MRSLIQTRKAAKLYMRKRRADQRDRVNEINRNYRARRMRDDPEGQRARELLAEQKYRAKWDGVSLETIQARPRHQSRTVRSLAYKSANAAYLEPAYPV